MSNTYSYNRSKKGTAKVPPITKGMVQNFAERIRRKIEAIRGVAKVPDHTLGIGFDAEGGYGFDFEILLDAFNGEGDPESDYESGIHRRYPAGPRFSIDEDPDEIAKDVEKIILSEIGLKPSEVRISIKAPEIKTEATYGSWSIESEQEWYESDKISVVVEVDFEE